MADAITEAPWGAAVGRSRRADPDHYVVDADRGSSDTATKRVRLLAPAAYAEREEVRAGARELDRTVEVMPGLNRQQRDRERAMPRDVAADVPHPVMERQLPAPQAVRVPLSSRQRKARSVVKRAVQDRLPDTQYTAVDELVSDPGRWQQVNDALSDATGDVQVLDEAQRRRVQRVDRAVQAHERASNRGHVVYANVQMTPAINASNLAAFVRNSFTPGQVIAFDRFTAGAHTLHEVEPDPEDADRTAVFEIRTRRGMYLGRSDSVDDTSHLLPRGMRLGVAGSHLARFRRPDGTLGTRQVIQLIDVTPPA